MDSGKQRDPTGPIETAPRVAIDHGTIVLDGDWCNVAYTPTAAIALARRLDEAVSQLAAANDARLGRSTE